MGENIKVAIIAGVFGLLGSLVGQLDTVHDILVSVGVKQATHVAQVSESLPVPQECDDVSDLGRVVLHSSSDGKSAIFFCPQGPDGKREQPTWKFAQGSDASEY